MSKAELKLDWCSHEAAKYAVEHWHYSKSLPAGKMVKIGAWEDQKFIGVILFSCGANRNIGSPYGLKQIEVCELVRVALTKHLTPVSRILAIAMKMLHGQSPGVKLIVSYADQNQDHHGGIYQAGNWVYVGQTGKDTNSYCSDWSVKMPNGVLMHRKTYASKYGKQKPKDIGLEYVINLPKHKYLYPLTPEIKAKIESLRKPYPKRAIAKGSQQANADNGGSLPTRSLQSSKASSSSEINSVGL